MTVELHHEPTTVSSLSEQMDYARAVSVASMLPENYRGKPADIMLAVGLGQSMGLSPAESLYRISVIKGKPTASAELIAANVRKAGHRLRVRGDDQSCTATIIRADDPDYEFAVTRDLEWAQRMGLHDQPNYRKQPGTMLQWRAITAVARLACPEALYGVAYTADEIDWAPSTGGGLSAALNAEHIPEPSAGGHAPDDGTSSTPVGSEREVGAVPPAEPEPLTKRTRGHLFALFAKKGVAEEDQLPGANHILGTDYTSRSEFTEDDALRLIAVLDSKPDAEPGSKAGVNE